MTYGVELNLDEKYREKLKTISKIRKVPIKQIVKFLVIKHILETEKEIQKTIRERANAKRYRQRKKERDRELKNQLKENQSAIEKIRK